MPSINQKLIVILGPTASGKSALAVTLAKKWNGEVISADSRQVYRGLTIGTGKITKKEMRGIPHHLLSVASPRTTFTVVQFQKRAERAVYDIAQRGKLPILCGGTGLYIDAVLYGYTLPLVMANAALRHKLDKMSPKELFYKLKKLDPRRARNIDQKNKRRLVRALEIILTAKEKTPKAPAKIPRYDALKLGIKKNPEALKRAIEKRVRTWIKGGLIAETKRLAQRVGKKRIREFGFNYALPYRYLQKQITKAELESQLKKENWRYVKRQMTWFKRDKDIHWVKNEKTALALTGKYSKK